MRNTTSNDGGRPYDLARRPWFASKRVGYGLRPASWQGWLSTTIAVAAVIVIAVATGGKLPGELLILIPIAALLILAAVTARR